MKYILIVLCFFTNMAFASFPENNLHIPPNATFKNSMTEEEFNQILERVITVYSPIIKLKKSVLILNKLWKSDAVNANASRFGGTTWTINIYGGIARHPLVTSDGLLFITCHELGHHLGGAPKIGGLRGYWSSTEGEADYFGGMKCMRKILFNDDNISIVKDMNVDSLLRDKCSSTYQNENEVALCERIGMAGKSLGDMLASLKGDNSVVYFNRPDKTIVTKTIKEHPNAQCRLDTYLSSVLCTKNFDEEIGQKDPSIGVCTKNEGYDLGLRPLCWYKPSRKEE
jgi:hypothetical protein